MENWYKDLSTSQLIDMATRLTRECMVNNDSELMWKEIEDLKKEVDKRLEALWNDTYHI